MNKSKLWLVLLTMIPSLCAASITPKACRLTVQETVHSHPIVLDKLDAFIQKLTMTFKKSEIEKILDAVVFAADKHRNQFRKDPKQTPYIIHPIGVASHLITIGRVKDTEIIIAALLHDTVEDTETTFEEINEIFGPRVASLVEEVTDDKTLPKHIRKMLQISHAPHKSPGAALIKLADKLYNLSDLLYFPPPDWTQERVDQYFVWAQTVVDNLPKVNQPLKDAVDATIQKYWSGYIN